LATTDAYCCDSAMLAGHLERVCEMQGNAGTRCTDGVSDGNRTTMDIEL